MWRRRAPLVQSAQQFIWTAKITLMSDVGQTFDALIFVEVELGEIKQVYLSAFSAMRPDTDYRLIGIESQVNPGKLAELSDPIFYPGTQITLADGAPMRCRGSQTRAKASHSGLRRAKRDIC